MAHLIHSDATGAHRFQFPVLPAGIVPCGIYGDFMLPVTNQLEPQSRLSKRYRVLASSKRYNLFPRHALGQANIQTHLFQSQQITTSI